jgi:hypothetical protein
LIIGFATSIQCQADVALKQGIQVRILVPQLSRRIDITLV